MRMERSVLDFWLGWGGSGCLVWFARCINGVVI